MDDSKTTEYFNKNLPEFALERFNYTIDFLNTHAQEEHVLADIGCGNGNILEYIKQNTPIKNLIGIDNSSKYIEQVKQRLNCQTFCGSVLDENFFHSLHIQCDFIVMGALLHHLVGKSRKKSWINAQNCIENALSLLKNGGYLIIHEPAFYPPFIMTVIFWIKKIVSKVFPGRITIWGRWNNIGAPVVSYYTNEQITSFLSSLHNVRLIDVHIVEIPLKKLWRLSLISFRSDTTFVLRKM